MDIENMMRQLRELTEWKKRVEPMLADMLQGYDEHLARKAERQAEEAALGRDPAEGAAPNPTT